MEPQPRRFGSFLDGIVVVAFLAATVGVTYLLVRELRSTPTAPPRQAAPAATPVAQPEGRVVPALMLSDGRQVKFGQRMSEVTAALGAGTDATGSPEQGRLGARHTRHFTVDGTRFTVIFEPLEQKGEPRVAAIYMQ